MCRTCLQLVSQGLSKHLTAYLSARRYLKFDKNKMQQQQQRTRLLFGVYAGHCFGGQATRVLDQSCGERSCAVDSQSPLRTQRWPLRFTEVSWCSQETGSTFSSGQSAQSQSSAHCRADQDCSQRHWECRPAAELSKAAAALGSAAAEAPCAGLPSVTGRVHESPSIGAHISSDAKRLQWQSSATCIWRHVSKFPASEVWK